MTWYIDFCAPFMPNDPAINFHRFFQTSLLAAYTICYIVLHAYYLYWGPLPLTHESDDHPDIIQNKQKQQKESDNSSNLSEHKEVSIKLDQQANESCIQLKKTSMSTWNQSNSNHSDKEGSIMENVTIHQIEQYNGIVYGHFAVAMGLSIMYTPYAEQTIAALLYTLLTIPLLVVNAKRMEKTTRLFWIIMAILLIFIFTCGLLEVGQSNWDVINQTCFSTEYVSIYD